MFLNSRYPKAERIFFGILAAIAVIGLIGIAVAANIQSWQDPATGTNVATLDTAGNLSLSGTGGSLNLSGSGAFNYSPTGGSLSSGTTAVISGGTLNGGILTGGTLTAGLLNFYMPNQGTQFKQLIISGSGVTATSNTLAFTLPTAFAGTAGTLGNFATGNLLGFAMTAGTSGILTLASTGSQGTLIIGGR